jgi:[ribosomal protein S5]-alanine N-acetyltransferase
MNFQPFPTLHTERLILRHITKADAADLFVFRSDPEVMKYIPRPLANEIADVYPLIEIFDDFWTKGEKINWGIALKETDKIIGMIGYVKILPEHYRAEVGYSLTAAYQRQGITREALKRIIQFGFEEMGLHSIEAIIDAENTASGALLLNVGFKQEAFFREDFYYNNNFRNSIHFGLLSSERQV